MANRKYGGREWSDPNDFKLRKGDSNPWEAQSSGQGYNSRWSDDEGYKRGAQSQGKDDAAFLSASQSRTDHGDVHQRLSRLIDGQVDQPAGPMLGGGGKVSENLEDADKDKHRPYRDGKGPASNDGL